MYVELGSAFYAMGARLATHAAQIEVILSAHRRRLLVLCVSPRENNYLRDYSGVGPGGLAALRSMAARAPDYRAGAGLSKRFVTVVPDEALLTDFRIMPTGHLEARLGYMCRRFDNSIPGLFVEHIENDRFYIELIFKLQSRRMGLSEDLVVFRPVHGGGSTIADVLRVRQADGLMGLCIVDRDTSVSDPNLCKPGGTADHAFSALAELNVFSKSESGLSDTEPMFGFTLTGSRTIESYIGPHLLDVYFDHQPQARGSRASFTNAYRNFPDLTDSQFMIWMTNNLKDGRVSNGELKSCVTSRGGIIEPETRLHFVSSARIPAGCARWLLSEVNGRFRKEIKEAFEKDMQIDEYKNAVERLFELSWDLLAADQRMKLA